MTIEYVPKICAECVNLNLSYFAGANQLRFNCKKSLFLAKKEICKRYNKLTYDQSIEQYDKFVSVVSMSVICRKNRDKLTFSPKHEIVIEPVNIKTEKVYETKLLDR